jgi:hypothetical protein
MVLPDRFKSHIVIDPAVAEGKATAKPITQLSGHSSPAEGVDRSVNRQRTEHRRKAGRRGDRAADGPFGAIH